VPWTTPHFLKMIILILFFLSSLVFSHAQDLSFSGKHTRDEIISFRNQFQNVKVIDDSASSGAVLTVTPSKLSNAFENVTVSWTGVTNPNSTTDWIGLFCIGYPIGDYYEYDLSTSSSTWMQGYGSLSFIIFQIPCIYEFRFYRGKPPLYPVSTLLATSNNITWDADNKKPYQIHLSLGTIPQKSMYVSWTSSVLAPGLVRVGKSSGFYTWNVSTQEIITYNAADLCTAPANTSSIDYWTFPGYFYHTLLVGLEANTRYFVLPIVGEVAGEEITFKTASEVGSFPVTFAHFGDNWVSGGDGSVMTHIRLKERIDISNDLAFILHYGDLGYAKGFVKFWDQWTAYASINAKFVPYQV
jgi:Purple acid Phosphatase, N-terminal domain